MSIHELNAENGILVSFQNWRILNRFSPHRHEASWCPSTRSRPPAGFRRTTRSAPSRPSASPKSCRTSTSPAPKSSLDDLAGQFTSRVHRLSDRIDELEEQLGDRIDEKNDRIDHLDETVATKAEPESVKSDLGNQIEETHGVTIRTVVGAVAAMGATLPIVIPLAIFLMG